jgi:hypothetical protein
MRARGLVLILSVLTALVAASVSNADIVHRYSFDEDARDSVGTAHGILEGQAVAFGGFLFLDGSAGSYVRLPIGETLGRLNRCTIEGWVIWGSFQNPWSRIFDFGNDTLEYMFLAPRNGSNHRVRFAATVGGFADEEQTTAALRFPVEKYVHFAVVMDADIGYTALYLNGQAAAFTFFTQFSPSDMAAPTQNNYLGRSQYPADPYFFGFYDEFRIYDNPLSPDEVFASFLAGPNP